MVTRSSTVHSLAGRLLRSYFRQINSCDCCQKYDKSLGADADLSRLSCKTRLCHRSKKYFFDCVCPSEAGNLDLTLYQEMLDDFLGRNVHLKLLLAANIFLYGRSRAL